MRAHQSARPARIHWDEHQANRLGVDERRPFLMEHNAG